ncbi:unnamed protein product, partial [Mesorhabditis spiculigera]
MILRGVFITFLLLLAASGRPSNDTLDLEAVADPKAKDAERNLQRTLSVVEHRSALGRIVLLVCQKACKPLRAIVPELVRDYNELKEYSSDDLISYHYHYLRGSLPFYNTSRVNKRPAVLYISAGSVEEYEGDPSDRTTFLEWLRSVDKSDVLIPKSHQELDAYLTEAEQCQNAFLLIIHDPNKCPYDFWRNVARVVYAGTKIPTILLERPIENQIAVTLFRRLVSMPQDCLLVSLIHHNQYTKPFVELAPAEILENVRRTLEFSTCLYEPDGKIFTKTGIRSSLTDLQMEYYATDYDLKKLEHKTSYIAVGLAGGIAVIALAISIFWGLNGSAFTRE